jgi:DNA-binding transcriptional ArsR family regulator
MHSILSMASCKCESKAAELCCPGDGDIRKKWLVKLEKEHSSIRQASKEIAGKSKIFSNTDRVEILLMLEQREHCMDEIAKKLKIPKPSLSYHLGLLKKKGLICVRKRSRFAFYHFPITGLNSFILSKQFDPFKFF